MTEAIKVRVIVLPTRDSCYFSVHFSKKQFGSASFFYYNYRTLNIVVYTRF